MANATQQARLTALCTISLAAWVVAAAPAAAAQKEVTPAPQGAEAARVQTGRPATEPEKGKPFNEQEVIRLLKGGVPSHKVAAKVNERGIDFEFTAQSERKVRDAGGNELVVSALKQASQRRAQSVPPRPARLTGNQAKEDSAASQAPSPLPTPSSGIPVPGVKVTAVKFFEGPHEVTPEESQRVYGYSFDRFTTRAVYWELDLSFPPPRQRINFQIDAFWYKPDGSEMTRQTISVYVEPDWESSWHTAGSGYAEPGHWIPGSYRVDLYCKNRRVASGTFQID